MDHEDPDIAAMFEQAVHLRVQSRKVARHSNRKSSSVDSGVIAQYHDEATGLIHAISIITGETIEDINFEVEQRAEVDAAL